MYPLQPRFRRNLLGRLAIILTLLAAVEAGLSSSGPYLSPKLKLLPTITFAFGSSEAAASSHTNQGGFFKKLWDKLRGNSTPRPSPEAIPGPVQVPPPEESQRRDRLRKLQMRHDSEPDLSKKIDYDRQIIDILDPYVDFEKIRALQSEIEQHVQEAQQRAKEQQKQQAIRRAKRALEEKRYEDAEREAVKAVQISDDAQTQQLWDEVRTRQFMQQAKEALARKAVEEANEKNQQALKLAPNDPEAQRLQREIDNILDARKTVFVSKVVLSILLIAGLLTGLYFSLRPKRWVLEGIDGACKEEVFPLDTDEVKIGALGPPDGECDIVIRDARRRISRLHCLIVRNGRHLYLIDESTNGTKINDEEVEQGSIMRLRNGDQLSLAHEAVLLLRPK